MTSSLINRLASRTTFPAAGTVVACAVSGGADSLALLALAAHVGLEVTAVHVDHGLRPGSAGEAAVVEAAAARFGARFRAERVDLEAGPNLEARARAARYAVLPPGTLTGHTADDQAETILLNLLRGAGLAGLAGMGPDRHPLLALRRTETHALCAELDLRPVNDPTNDEPSWRRNRIRHELLPFLSEVAGRDLVPVLTRQAGLLRDEAALLDELAAVLDPTDARALAQAPVALSRRAVRRWIHDGEHPPDAATVERVLAVARLETEGCEIGDGREVRRTGGRLRLEGH